MIVTIKLFGETLALSLGEKVKVLGAVAGWIGGEKWSYDAAKPREANAVLGFDPAEVIKEHEARRNKKTL